MDGPNEKRAPSGAPRHTNNQDAILPEPPAQSIQKRERSNRRLEAMLAGWLRLLDYLGGGEQ